MPSLKGKEYKRFEDIKHIREDGSEYWSARELAPALEYTQWRNFENVIKRAMIACENSGLTYSREKHTAERKGTNGTAEKERKSRNNNAG